MTTPRDASSKAFEPQTMQVEPFCGSAARDVVIACPPDKSITHRAMILASMARGVSHIERPLLGQDCRSTMAAFAALGVRFSHESGAEAGAARVTVDSPGWDHWSSPLGPLDFGNSGTTARLLTGLFAATPGLFVAAFGDESLSQRPMGRVVKPLQAMGACIVGRREANFFPLAVDGRTLRPAHHPVEKASAQVKSALILAGLNISGETVVTLPIGGRDHTEKMLQNLGADLRVSVAQGYETIAVRGPFRPDPRVYEVPGDPSSAAFLAVLGILRPRGRLTLRRVLVNPTRTGFLEVLRRMGASMTTSQPHLSPGLLEPVCDVTLEGGHPLRAVETSPDLVPTMIDEIPILAVAALFADGISVFRGLSELRVKESDRLLKTMELITLAGGRAFVRGDDLHVEGMAQHPSPRLQGFRYDPAKDHRLAMACAVLAKRTMGPCTIVDPQCVDVSFPGFFKALAEIDA